MHSPRRFFPFYLATLLPLQVLTAAVGDVDATFNPAVSGGTVPVVVAVSTQADGSLVIGGSFTSVNGTARTHVASLNDDGTLVAGFNPALTVTSGTARVGCVTLQPNGRLIVGGNFEQVDAVNQRDLVRLNADGTRDTTFSSPFGVSSTSVLCATVQTDGKVLVGGTFNPFLTRLTSTGLDDPGYLTMQIQPLTSPLQAVVNSAVVQADGKIVIGGLFNVIRDAVSNLQRVNLARYFSNGSLDRTYVPKTNEKVFAMALQRDGKLIIGGYFTTVNGTTRNRIARLNSDGSLDTTFNPNVSTSGGEVKSIVLQTDGKIIIGGRFDTVGGLARSNIARLNASGSVDTTFAPSANGEVYGVSLDKSGRVLMGGTFTRINGDVHEGLARIGNSTGTSTLSVPDSKTVKWLRSGSVPETFRVTFELSTDGGSTWSSLGTGTRLTNNVGWSKTGLSLPAAGKLRARAVVPGGFYNASASLLQEQIDFVVQPDIAVEQPVGSGLSNGGSAPSFGSLPVGSSASATFTVKNVGNASLTGLAFSLSGPDAADFVLTPPTISTLAIGASTTCTVTFKPSALGARSAILNMASNDPDEAPFTLTLEGDGLAGVAFRAADFFFKEESGTQPVTVQRTGSTTGAVTVKVNSTNGTALAGEDYDALTDVLVSFADGEATKTVDVVITNDVKAEANEAFTLTLSDATGATLGTPSVATVRIVEANDTTKPTVVVTVPAVNASVNEGFARLTGSAADNRGIEKVEASINGGAVVDVGAVIAVSGRTATFNLALTGSLAPVPGLNQLTIISTDTRGNASAPLVRNFTYLVPRPLVVNVSGPANSGILTAPFPGTDATRKVGLKSTLKATPRTGYMFTGWTNTSATPGTGLTAAALELPTITFTHQEGLELTAGFRVIPYGSFNGLALASLTDPPPTGTVPSNETTGFINVVVAATGSFTGKLKIDGFTLSFAGAFDGTGAARFGTSRATSVALVRKGKTPLTLALTMDLDVLGTHQITGTVSSASAVSEITADRAAFSSTSPVPAVYAGIKSKPWTVAFPHRSAQVPALATNLWPQGDGYALGSISAAGTVTLSGRLADHTAISVSVPLSKDLTWPLFAQLYSLKGCVAGLVKLDDTQADTDMASTAAGVLWFRPAQTVQWYPAGWPQGIQTDLIGAVFTPKPAEVFPGLLATEPLNGNTELAFTSGLLTSAVSGGFNLTPTNGLTRASATPATFTFIPDFTKGFLRGNFPHTDGSKPAWQGVLLQKGANKRGHGYFLSTAPKPLDFLGESGLMRWIAR